jgi:hypothetical protein
MLASLGANDRHDGQKPGVHILPVFPDDTLIDGEARDVPELLEGLFPL